MTLRPFETEDVAWAAPLAERVFSAFEQGYGAQVARWASDPTVVGFVTETDIGPAGFVLIGSIGLVGDGRPRVLEVVAIAVDPSMRRQGLGRRLLARVVQLARADVGVREIRLGVAEDNAAARHLFEQAGFAVVRDDDGRLPDGRRMLRMTLQPARRAA
jgi:ribosomal protein S18 acetylase RimI-like enzyme